jgi:dolichyl-phosphate-mannose-protein mannosyltransferase
VTEAAFRETIYDLLVYCATKACPESCVDLRCGYNLPMENFLRNGLSSPLKTQSGYSQSYPGGQKRQEAPLASHPAKQSSLLSHILNRPAGVALILGVIGLSFFLAGIGKPPVMYYDEGFYVPEARSFLHRTDPSSLLQMHSLAKPPLGKIIVAMSIKAAGDNPFGWRVASALFGALTLVAVYLWTLLLLHDGRLAALAAGMTFFNNFLFVMSRVAMMDVFFVAFLMWSLLAYTAAIVLDLGVGKRRMLLISSGVLMGLSGACKWNAIDSLAVLFMVSVALLWLARRPSANSISCLSREARNIQEIGIPTLVIGLVVAPFVSYVLTYWPQCRILQQPFSIHELIVLHRLAWEICTTWPSNPTISSAWYTWPLSLSPQRGLSYLLANPVVAWGGLVALIFCLWRFWKTVAMPEGLILLLFAANFFQWAVTPEKGLFYYYYYPAVMILGVTIAVALRSLPRTVFGVRVSVITLVAAAIVFLWCLPRMAHLEAPWDCALGCWS